MIEILAWFFAGLAALGVVLFLVLTYGETWWTILVTCIASAFLAVAIRKLGLIGLYGPTRKEDNDA